MVRSTSLFMTKDANGPVVIMIESSYYQALPKQQKLMPMIYGISLLERTICQWPNYQNYNFIIVQGQSAYITEHVFFQKLVQQITLKCKVSVSYYKNIEYAWNAINSPYVYFLTLDRYFSRNLIQDFLQKTSLRPPDAQIILGIAPNSTVSKKYLKHLPFFWHSPIGHSSHQNHLVRLKSQNAYDTTKKSLSLNLCLVHISLIKQFVNRNAFIQTIGEKLQTEDHLYGILLKSNKWYLMTGPFDLIIIQKNIFQEFYLSQKKDNALLRPYLRQLILPLAKKISSSRITPGHISFLGTLTALLGLYPIAFTPKAHHLVMSGVLLLYLSYTLLLCSEVVAGLKMELNSKNKWLASLIANYSDLILSICIIYQSYQIKLPPIITAMGPVAFASFPLVRIVKQEYLFHFGRPAPSGIFNLLTKKDFILFFLTFGLVVRAGHAFLVMLGLMCHIHILSLVLAEMFLNKPTLSTD